MSCWWRLFSSELWHTIFTVCYGQVSEHWDASVIWVLGAGDAFFYNEQLRYRYLSNTYVWQAPGHWEASVIWVSRACDAFTTMNEYLPCFMSVAGAWATRCVNQLSGTFYLQICILGAFHKFMIWQVFLTLSCVIVGHAGDAFSLLTFHRYMFWTGSWTLRCVNQLIGTCWWRISWAWIMRATSMDPTIRRWDASSRRWTPSSRPPSRYSPGTPSSSVSGDPDPGESVFCFFFGFFLRSYFWHPPMFSGKLVTGPGSKFYTVFIDTRLGFG